MEVEFGLLGFVAGVGAKVFYDLATRAEPAWARRLMKHVEIGGLAHEGESLRRVCLGSGAWTGGIPATYYLVWRTSKAVRDLQAHLELRSPIEDNPYYVLEIYHSWKVPREQLLITDLPYEVIREEDLVLIVRFPIEVVT